MGKKNGLDFRWMAWACPLSYTHESHHANILNINLKLFYVFCKSIDPVSSGCKTLSNDKKGV